MNLAAPISILFPRPRRRVTVGQALVPAAFLAVFAAGCLAIEFAGVLTFTRPMWFLLMAVTPWLWWLSLSSLAGLSGGRAAVALVTRLCLVGVFAMLLAEPRAVRRSNDLCVMFALDVSDSIGEGASDAALRYVVQSVTRKPRKDQAGLVVFARDAAVELPPGITFPFEAINSRVARDATSLEKGLSLAGTMIPRDINGRIVLVSDGTQTEGNLSRVLDDLASRGVVVDVLPVEYAYDDEVWLEKLELPRFVKTGETYEAAVILSSLKSGRGKLVLRENGKVIHESTVDYAAGKNRYVLPLRMREPGYYEYVAVIEPPPGKDGWKENNTAINYLFLKGEGKVLLVTDPDGDDRDWKTLADSLKKAERVVEQMPAQEFPRDVMSLMPYDAIVFVNVPADAFDAVQLAAVRDAVANQGAGFLMVGGRNSFGPGGYHRTPVEEALPVSMDITQKKVMPKGALVIVLHTCEFPEGNTWAKRITKEAIRVLGARDDVGVLLFNWGAGGNGEQWLFPLIPAGEYDKLVPLINKAEPGDMPSFGPTMQMAFDALKKSDAATRHVIIISDGNPEPPTPKLLNDYVAEKISVSTVAVSPHGNDVAVMRSIAGATGGRFYFPQDPNMLPSIFIKEAKTLKRSMIQEKTFVPTVEFPSEILKGIGALPELKGYVLTTPKPRSHTVLKGPDAEEVDPVLSVWRFGTGQSAAFTSDLSPKWGASWVGWDKYHAFVKQLITDISRAETKTDLTLQAFAEGNRGIIVAEDYYKDVSFLEIEAQVAGPRGTPERVKLRQVAPRRYQGDFELSGRGRYQVMAAAAGPGRSERATAGFVVPYSPEYLRFRSNPATLREIAQRTGGRMLTGRPDDVVFVPERESRSSSRSVIDWFLIALACLIPLDVGVRRVQLDWAVVRGWFVREGKRESEKTLGALLERKKAIEFGPKEEEARQTAERLRRLAEAAAAAPIVEREAKPAPTIPPAAAEEKPAAPEDASTTGRLLRMKKKWKGDGE